MNKFTCPICGEFSLAVYEGRHECPPKWYCFTEDLLSLFDASFYAIKSLAKEENIATVYAEDVEEAAIGFLKWYSKYLSETIEEGEVYVVNTISGEMSLVEVEVEYYEPVFCTNVNKEFKLFTLPQEEKDNDD